jgi:hypothetical protein
MSIPLVPLASNMGNSNSSEVTLAAQTDESPKPSQETDAPDTSTDTAIGSNDLESQSTKRDRSKEDPFADPNGGEGGVKYKTMAWW